MKKRVKYYTCQTQAEGGKLCVPQCEHCESYFRSLDKEHNDHFDKIDEGKDNAPTLKQFLIMVAVALVITVLMIVCF